MAGLGRMGANLVRRLMNAGHDCVVFDVSPGAVKELEAAGATGAASLDDLVAKLARPRAVPAPTLATALFSRFGSRDLDHFANQVQPAMCKGFGGHAEKPAG